MWSHFYFRLLNFFWGRCDLRRNNNKYKFSDHYARCCFSRIFCITSESLMSKWIMMTMNKIVIRINCATIIITTKWMRADAYWQIFVWHGHDQLQENKIFHYMLIGNTFVFQDAEDENKKKQLLITIHSR